MMMDSLGYLTTVIQLRLSIRLLNR